MDLPSTSWRAEVSRTSIQAHRPLPPGAQAGIHSGRPHLLASGPVPRLQHQHCGVFRSLPLALASAPRSHLFSDSDPPASLLRGPRDDTGPTQKIETTSHLRILNSIPPAKPSPRKATYLQVLGLSYGQLWGHRPGTQLAPKGLIRNEHRLHAGLALPRPSIQAPAGAGRPRGS